MLHRALFVTRTGSAPAMEWRDMPCPQPAAGEILVRIAASTLSWGDAIQAQGRYVGGPTPPYVPGHDFAGEIVAVGSGVAGASVGTRVFGLLPHGGALAEHVAMPAGWASATPDGVSDVAAAAIAASFFTADAALHFPGAPRAEDLLVVHAGAGGLGSAAIQLGVALGIGRIFATAEGQERQDFARAMGAHAACGYADFAEMLAQFSGGRGADLILESVGGALFDASIRALAPFGRLVSVGASSAEAPGPLRMTRIWRNSLSLAGIHLSSWITDFPERLAPTRQRVAQLLAAGRIRAVVDSTVPAADAAQAFQRLSARSVRGRIAVTLQH